MAKVRATQPCFLHDVGYKAPEDGEFEYGGPPHHCLEPAETPAAEGGDVKKVKKK